MNEFLNYIKEYISQGFTNDSEITKTVTIENAYKSGNEIKTDNVPQVQVQIMDNSEVQAYTSFEGENISAIPLQITSYTAQMKIGGTMRSAQEASIIFGQKLKNMLDKLALATDNENIKLVVRTTMSPALPLLEGKVYTTAIRYNFWVATLMWLGYNHKKMNKENKYGNTYYFYWC